MHLRIVGLIIVALGLARPAHAEVEQIIGDDSLGHYNEALGTILDGTDPGFPPDGNPTILDPAEPNLDAAAAILGGWLATPPELNENWSGPQSIPFGWQRDDETAVIYTFGDDSTVWTDITIRIGVDNGAFVWLDGRYLGGQVRGGGVVLGELTLTVPELGPGQHHLQVIREDHGGATGFRIDVTGQAFRGCGDDTPGFVAACEAETLILPASPGDGAFIEVFNRIGGSAPPRPDILQDLDPDGVMLSPVIDFPSPGQVVQVGDNFEVFFADTAVPPDEVANIPAENFILRITGLLQISSELDLDPATPEIDIRLGVGSDDGFHLVVGETFLGEKGVRSFNYRWADVAFETGGLYPLTLLFAANATGQSGLEFAWDTAIAGVEIIPQQVLHLTETPCETKIEFEEFDAGTIVADQYADLGIRFAVLGGDLQITDAFPEEFVPVSGDRVFADPSDSPIDEGVVEFTFVVPGTDDPATTSRFSLFVLDAEDIGSTITAFSPDGTQIFSTQVNAGGGSQELVVIEAPLIARVVVTLGAGADTSAIDNICFDTPVVGYPDLRVAAPEVPPSGVVGEPFEVAWIVSNHGQAVAAGPWMDTIYISDDDQFDAGDTVLGTFASPGSLEPGSEYQRILELDLPGQPGDYWIVVETDSTDLVDEVGGEGNNVRVSESRITVTSVPIADLVVYGLVTPAEVSTGEPFEVRWTVANVGMGIAEAPWSDRVYISTDDVWDEDDSVVATVAAPAELPPGVSYQQSASIAAPDLPETYHVFVRADLNNQVDELAGGWNNLSQPSDPIVVEYPDAPDLVVTAAVGPESAESDSIVSVSWTTCNQGDLATDGLWRDRVYLLNADPTTGDDLLVGEFVRTDTIEPRACVEFTGLVQVPLEVVGPRYLVVVTDAMDDLDEGGGESNNAFVSETPIEFVEPALPDLVIDAILPAGGVAGDMVTIGWIGRNDGAAATGTIWRDEVYLSGDTSLDPGDVLLGTRLNIGALEPGGTWSQTGEFMLPSSFGPKFVLVAVDTENVIEEGTGESNNLGVSPSTIEITPPPRPDLVAVVTAAPPSAVAGDSIEISWMVTNQGAATSAGGWSDAVYLSDDQSLDSGDELLRLQPYNAGPLDVGVGYDRTAAITLPVSYTAANRYLLVATDFNLELAESDERNNVDASSVIPIARTPASDLSVAEVVPASDAATFGGTIDLTFRVANTGDLDATGPWTDYVLLSVDDRINTGDLPVGIVSYDGDPVLVGGEYVQSATAELPLSNQFPDGNYRLIVVSDAANAIRESDEANNEGVSDPITLVRPPLPDLAVSVSDMPGEVSPGVPFDVTLTFSNAGSEPITGNWFTSISLGDSGGTVDTLLQDFITANTIEPGASAQVVRSVTVPDSGADDIVLVLQVDSRDDQVEADESNNGFTTPAAIYRRPDLVAVSVSVPPTAAAGEVVNLTVTGRNDGTAPSFGFWTDVVSLSPDDTVGSDRVIGATTFTEAVLPGDTYTRTFAVTLPEDLEGTYRPVLEIDPADSLRELEDDNAAFIDLGASIEILQPDRSNLVVGSIDIPGTIMAGATFEIGYSVTNEGPADANGSWIDQVWLSANGVLSNEDIIGAQALRPITLPVGTDYTQTVTVTAPTTPGAWSIFVQTDAGDTVIEQGPSGESDNIRLAGTQLIVREVVVVASIVEDEVQLGTPLTIEGSATVAGSGEPAPNAPVRVTGCEDVFVMVTRWSSP